MQSPIQFLLITLFDLYVMVVLLRFMLQLFRADFYNPISQFVVTVTNPVLVPMRKVIPGFGGIDVSSLIFAYLVVLLKYVLLSVMFSQMPGVGILMLVSVLNLVVQAINLVFWLVLVRVILSWVNPNIDNPFVLVIHQITEPIMAPFRRIIPPIGGLDLSPIVLIIGLQFLLRLIQSI